MEEQVEVDALPVCIEVQTEVPVRSTLTDLCAVVAGDYAVTVDVNEAGVTRTCRGLNETSVSIGVGVHFPIVLEHASGLVTVEVGERHAVRAASQWTTCESLYTIVFDEARLITEILQRGLGVGGISLHREVGIADVPLVTQFELNTLVFHITDVTDWFVLTYVRRYRHGHQHAVGLLNVVVNGKRQSLIEET